MGRRDDKRTGSATSSASVDPAPSQPVPQAPEDSAPFAPPPPAPRRFFARVTIFASGRYAPGDEIPAHVAADFTEGVEFTTAEG